MSVASVEYRDDCPVCVGLLAVRDEVDRVEQVSDHLSELGDGDERRDREVLVAGGVRTNVRFLKSIPDNGHTAAESVERVSGHSQAASLTDGTEDKA